MELLKWLGCGIVFGMGACFGVAISAFAVTILTKQGKKDMNEHYERVEKLLKEKVDAINSVASAIEEHK